MMKKIISASENIYNKVKLRLSIFYYKITIKQLEDY